MNGKCESANVRECESGARTRGSYRRSEDGSTATPAPRGMRPYRYRTLSWMGTVIGTVVRVRSWKVWRMFRGRAVRSGTLARMGTAML